MALAGFIGRGTLLATLQRSCQLLGPPKIGERDCERRLIGEGLDYWILESHRIITQSIIRGCGFSNSAAILDKG